MAAVADAISGKDLFKKAQNALPKYLATFSKGQEWGRRLMAFAMKNKETTDGRKRPVVEAVELAFSFQNESFVRMRSSHRVKVDEQGGRLVPVVPDLSGKGLPEAGALLRKSYLSTGEVTGGAEGQETVVTETAPKAGTLVERGNRVDLRLGSKRQEGS